MTHTTQDRTLYTAWGYRFSADGWSDQPEPLFRFRRSRGESVEQTAEYLRRKGLGGLATHQCEDFAMHSEHHVRGWISSQPSDAPIRA